MFKNHKVSHSHRKGLFLEEKTAKGFWNPQSFFSGGLHELQKKILKNIKKKEYLCPFNDTLEKGYGKQPL